MHERHAGADETGSARQQQPTGYEREPSRYPPAESPRAKSQRARPANPALHRGGVDELSRSRGASPPQRGERLICGLEATVRLLRETLHDGIGQPARDPGIHVARHRDRVGEVLAHDLGAGIAVVGRRARDHLEEHGAERVQIAPPVQVRCAQRLLGAHVLHGADGEAGRRLRAPSRRRAGIEQLRDPEIHEQRAAGLRFEHHVVGLDVAVHEPLGVRVRQGLEDRLRDPEGLVGRVRPPPTQRVGERFPLDERHHIVDEALALPDEVDRQDGRVLEARERLGFLAKAGEHAGSPGDLGVQHFTGEAAVQVLVPQLVHLGEPAASHEPLDLVLGAERAGETLGGRHGRRGRRGLRRGGDPLVGDDGRRGVAARGAERRARGNLRTTRRARHLLGGHGT